MVTGRSVRIPSVGMERIVEQIAVRIVAGTRQRVLILRVIPWVPGQAARLAEIAERVVAEDLSPERAAVHIQQSAQIVVTRYGRSSVVAGLRACGIESVRNRQR